jgi:hypothetical protein
MNIIVMKHPKLIGLVVAAALSLGAGGAAWAASDYKFEAADCLSGHNVAVSIIDKATGKSITNAQVFAVHRQWLPGKGAPTFVDRKVALSPDGAGHFTYQGNDVQPGANIRLIAQLDGSDISGNIDIC